MSEPRLSAELGDELGDEEFLVRPQEAGDWCDYTTSRGVYSAVLPLPDDRRTRCLVEKHVREIVGETFYESGESVRDRIEMARRGGPVDVEALAGTGPVRGLEALLRWLLE